MQIKCENCKTISNAILSQHTFQSGYTECIPVYSCENCGEHYIKLFSHAMLVKNQQGRYTPVGELIVNAFIEDEKEYWDGVNWILI